MLSKVKLFKTWVSTAPYGNIINSITKLAKNRKSSYICFANAHMLTEAYQNPEFNNIVNQASIVSPDGKPLSVLMKLQYGINQERACGMDMFPDLLREAQAKDLSVFFYGSTQEVLNEIIFKAGKEYPDLKIAGAFSPPFRPLTPDEDKAVVDMINASQANLVFVSLGCPKQEKWMHEHQGKVNACMLGLGQAFLTYAGMEKRLPKWARDLSLEWMYRLCLEPRRLWKRYLIGNTHFMFLAAKSLVAGKTSVQNQNPL